LVARLAFPVRLCLEPRLLNLCLRRPDRRELRLSLVDLRLDLSELPLVLPFQQRHCSRAAALSKEFGIHVQMRRFVKKPVLA